MSTSGVEVNEQATDGAAAPDFSAMSQEELVAYLSRRRQELSQINKVAKERGIKVPKSKRPTDVEKFSRLADNLGYSIGMRHWAQSRVSAVERQLGEVISLLGEAFDDEKAEEMRELMAGGYARAQRHTSFPSEVITKENRETIAPGEVWPEVEDQVERFAEFHQDGVTDRLT